MTHALLAKVLDGVGIELSYIETLKASPRVVAEVAASEGFHLMYEMDREPNMRKANKLARKNKLVTLDGVVRLWDLRK